MPSSDYTNAVGGGLKLKDSVDKKKKKKKASSSKPATTTSSDPIPKPPAEGNDESTALQKAPADEGTQSPEVIQQRAKDLKDFGKTESQRQFEERRKKRLDERLKRKGVQTHKERVQQLNKYLSTLSEHNDMPRIGPG